ncbi:response regulator [Streptococcus sp. NLN76]|uniref:ANTAR domain-containing response regulator n=1 Tax=Streptococcus sp. NLN76 TaxID=2822800 RepID=UPI0018AB0CF1|nr:response regulator [Streptococcus sp. NLN76]MBF8969704.1 response regulator [Streptococcus sp. NLN76]
MKSKIVIVDDDPIVRLDIRHILESGDYQVVAEAKDGFEAIEVCQKFHPDLVLMDIQLPLLDGLTASKKILDDRLAYSVMLLSGFSDDQYIQKAKKYGTSAYLIKPLDAKSLIPMIEVCLEKGRETYALKDETDKLSKKIEDRIIIEKAKGMLMYKENLTEPEAFKQIRSISMQKRVPMIEIAKLLLLHDEL